MNHIKKLKKEDGGMVEGEEALKSYIANYYKGLSLPVQGGTRLNY